MKRQQDSTLTLRQSVSCQPNYPWALKIKVTSSYDCISNEFHRTIFSILCDIYVTSVLQKKYLQIFENMK